MDFLEPRRLNLPLLLLNPRWYFPVFPQLLLKLYLDLLENPLAFVPLNRPDSLLESFHPCLLKPEFEWWLRKLELSSSEPSPCTKKTRNFEVVVDRHSP